MYTLLATLLVDSYTNGLTIDYVLALCHNSVTRLFIEGAEAKAPTEACLLVHNHGCIEYVSKFSEMCPDVMIPCFRR